jgi:GT2 family glycosyltransferase
LSHSISVIIVTWNAHKHLETFLPSVTNTEFENFEIIIADNASTDESVEWIRKHHPECKIVTFPRNYGYCGGNNRAADHATGDIIVFLNNDVEVTPDWLTCIDEAFQDSDVAALQPKILSYTERDKFEYAGAAGGFLDKLGYPFCRGRVFDTTEADVGQYNDSIPIFWASGAALAIRKNLFFELGRFDDDFMFHMEEVDLCWRLWNRGYKIISMPESVVYHLGGGSLPMKSSRKTYFNFRNSLSMLWKNASGEWLKKHFVLRLCLDGLAAIYALFKGNPGDSFAIFKAHMHFYTHWKQVHAKRIELQKVRTHYSEPDTMIHTSIIKDYFLKSRKTYNQIMNNVTNDKVSDLNH